MRITHPLNHCGLFWLCQGQEPLPLPLEGVHVSARVVDLVAEVQVVQFYVNPSGHPIDTKYEFPLDETAAVCGFEAELDDRLLIGQVREKEEARAEYHAAISRGETAALLEQEKPDVFVQRIGNIKPYSRINIRITYVADLSVEADGAVRFVLPTSVAPRYSPYVSAIPAYRCERVGYVRDFERVFAVARDPLDCYASLPWYEWRYYKPEHVVDKTSPCAFSMTVEVETPSAVTNITSTTHTIQWQPAADGSNVASASFWSDTQPMGKDVVLSIHQHAPHEPHVELELAPDGSGCAMVTMVPEFDLDPEPTEIVFLVDCSGSMRGNRMNAAIRALQLFLRSLPMTCCFNIIKFGTRHSKLFSASRPYTQETLREASQHVQAMGANMGGTEIYKPLAEIFAAPIQGGGRARQVFVLTDGQVENTESVVEICRRNAHNSRVFSVGIGDEVSRHLVAGMARAATGTAEFIQGHELTGSSGVLEGKLMNQLKNATLPSITKIVLDWGTLGPIAGTPAADPALETADDAASSAPPAPSAPSAGCALTFRVRCEQTGPNEDLYVTGDAKPLGQWDPSAVVKMFTNQYAFPIWVATVEVPSCTPVTFKFLKKTQDGSLTFEKFEGKRTVTPEGSACTAECGQWDVLAPSILGNVVASPPTSVPPPTPVPAPTPVPPPTPLAFAPPTPRCPSGHELFVSNFSEGPYINGWVCDRCGTQGRAYTDRYRCMPCGFDICFHCQPNTPPAAAPGGAPGVSKFFPTGPAQQRPGMMSFVGTRAGGGASVHGIGSGPAFHAPSVLAPAVGAHHDASSAQAHGRNSDIFQAPFLPPPVFSGTKFVMYAMFAPGRLPQGPVRIVASAPQGELVIDVPITKLTSSGKTLHVLAARALIRDLEEGTSHLHWRKTDVPAHLRSGGSGYEHRWFRGWLEPFVRPVGGAGQDKGSAWNLEPVSPPAYVVRNEMIDLGVRFGITSSVTSFVAVERFRDGTSGSSMAPLPLPSQQPLPQPQLQQQHHSQGLPFSFMSSSGLSPRSSSVSSSAMAGKGYAGSHRGRGGPPGRGASLPFDHPAPSACAPQRDSFAGDRLRKKKESDAGPMKRRCAAPKSQSFSQTEEESLPSSVGRFRESAPSAPIFDLCEDDFAAPPPGPVAAVFQTSLLMEQNFDGSFGPTATVCSCLGLSRASIEAAAAAHAPSFGTASSVIGLQLWTSILVLAYLRNTWASQESTWSLVAEKSRAWCIAALGKSLSIDRAAARAALEALVLSV